ncbi:MAG: DNA primase [Roseburia sp.]|nr:DNA primase [Roseburia sp.]
MPFYDENVIEEIRSRNDIVDVISGYVRLQKKGSNYFGLCPFHNEKSPSFSVSQGKQMYYCFGCGAGGNVFTFLMEYENFSFGEAVESLAQRAGVELPKQENPGMRQEADYRQRLLEVNREAGKFYYTMLRGEQGNRAMDYFKNRGLSQETMQKFGLGCCGRYSDMLYRYLRQKGYEDSLLKDSGLITYDERHGGRDKFFNRAMFPIMNVHNKIVGFGGRVMGDGEPKYLNSPETKIFDKSRNLYGLNFARASKKPQLLLCEGYMDVIALHQAGFDNAVASLGTSLTSGHASLLKRYTKEVYLTFDSDGAGVKAALRAIPILKEAGLLVKIINMEPYKDPDEFIKALGAEEYQKRIEESENSFLFEIRMLEKQFDLGDPEGKTAFYHEIARKLLGFTQELERNNYIEAVAEKYQIGFENLRRLVYHVGTLQGMAKPERPVKSGFGANKKKEDGMKQSQKLLLTWLASDLGLFRAVRRHITPEDFTEEIYRKVADLLFEQYENTGNVNPAQIISLFDGQEEQREIASLFHAKIQDIDSRTGMEKALKETIIRVKRNSIENRSRSLAPTDLAGLQQLLKDKQGLQELEKLHISIE